MQRFLAARMRRRGEDYTRKGEYATFALAAAAALAAFFSFFFCFLRSLESPDVELEEEDDLEFVGELL